MEILPPLILQQYQKLTSLQEASPVKTFRKQARELESQGVVLHFGNIFAKQLGYYDQSTHSLKMSQCSLNSDSMSSLQILPKSGMMRNGIIYQLPPLVRLINVKGSSSFATPTTMDVLPPKSQKALKKEYLITRKGRSKPANLRDQLMNRQNWPTPLASDHKSLTSRTANQRKRKRVPYFFHGDGRINPQFIEWMMGFPIGHSELSHLETQWFQLAQKSSHKRSKKN